MQLSWSDDDEAFRRELIAFLDIHAPIEVSDGFDFERDAAGDNVIAPWLQSWQAKLFDHGWMVPGFPPHYGGRDATPTQTMIYLEEMAARRMPRATHFPGYAIVAPSLLAHGNDQQKTMVPAAIRGDTIWCIGMSEPNAGSDLAGLQTRAARDGDTFIVNGQKVWTSGAHHADWCMCFVRTDPEVPKHKGISVLVIDMQSPGVEARPFAELTEPDYTDFNEVFFTDVEVPKAHLLGEVNQGWALTQVSLGHERAMLWIELAHDVQRALDALIAMGARPGPDGRPLREDPRFRAEVARFHVDAQALWLMGYRGFSKFMRGRAAPEHSLLKLFGSETLQQLLLTGAEFLGPESLDTSLLGPRMWREGAWITSFMRSFSGTIPGGTSEIQRNIIAERVLGLPRT